MEKGIIILFLGVLIGWFGNNVLHVEQTVPIATGAEVYEEDKNISWVSNTSDVENAFSDHLMQTGTRVKGLSVWNDNDCTIYAYEPKDVNDFERMETLGHELLHCFRGSYHD